MRLRNKDLQHFFDRANRLYFKNSLDSNIVVSFKKMRVLGRTTWVWFTRPVTKKEQRTERLGKKAIACGYIPRIYISDQFRDSNRLAITTLFHEMVHAESFGRRKDCESFGWNKFNKRMFRLAKQGAFNGLW